MKRTPTFAALVAVALLSGASAKPLSMQPDVELEGSLWAAEVEILEVNPPGGPGGRGGGIPITPGRVKVRLSADPERVYRGFAMMGEAAELTPARGGPSGCAADLIDLATRGVRPLMVVRPGKQIAFIGIRGERDGEVVYRMRHWCDWNAAWMFSVKDRFGKKLPRAGEAPMGGFEARRTEVRELLSEDFAAFALAVAEHLTAPPPAEPEGVDGWIADLDADDFVLRQRAERQLVQSGPAALAPLMRSLDAKPGPELAARIARILETLSRDATALRYANTLRRGDTADELRLLQTALGACDEKRDAELRLRIIARIVELADPEAVKKSGAPS